MMLINPDRLAALKQSGASAVLSEKKKVEPADIQIARLEDAYITKKEKKKNQEKRKLDDLAKRVKPLLSSNTADLQNVVKQNFSSNDQAIAQTIIDLLSKLPQVSIIDKCMLVKGQPLGDNVITVVQDIINNGVKNVEDVIQMLRGVKPNQSTRKKRRVKVSDNVTEEDFTEALIPFLSAQEPSAEMRSPRRVSTLSTPSKTASAVQKVAAASRIPHPLSAAAAPRKTPAKNAFAPSSTMPANFVFNAATAGQPAATSTPVTEYKISGYEPRSPYRFRARNKTNPRTNIQSLLNERQQKRGNGKTTLKWLSYDGGR